ncbi:hypothetical protein KFK09_026996 [Dendrobium nobile]|uniref:Mitochondrial protein n=1 Tax=Dendrobium nobile TaxID=94219 RepID=A0A8T3A957_DENNO|nr:hypothetical protein KFK09_026996 [Dendrobium nobile]
MTEPLNSTANSQNAPLHSNHTLSQHPMQMRLCSGISKAKPIFDLSVVPSSQLTPNNFTEASKHAHWRNAMSTEYLALQKQGTWSLVPAPPDKAILGSKWTFRTKLNSNNEVTQYKARLVA